MILSDREIRIAIEKKEIEISPFEKSQLQPASYDLRVGQLGVSASKKKKVRIDEDGLLSLEPGDFAVVEIHEKIFFNNQHVGRIGLRSKFARKGIIATTGPQIDPGYRGRLVVGLTNLTPKSVALSHLDDLLTIEIHHLRKPVDKPYRGPYQNIEGLTAEDIEMVIDTERMGISDMMKSLQSLSINVGTLSHEMKTIKWLFVILVTAIGLPSVVFGLITATKGLF